MKKDNHHSSEGEGELEQHGGMIGKKFVNAKVNGREESGSKRWDRKETGHSRRKNEVGTVSLRIENAEVRGDEHLFTCTGAPTPVVRSSGNGLNALRDPRYDSTCETRTAQGHRDVKLANPPGGVRL